MPTSASNTLTNDFLENVWPHVPHPIINVPFGNSLTLAKGTVVAIKTSDGKYYAYNDSLSDGTQVARGILQYAIVTDGSGNVYFGGAASSEHGEKFKVAPIYIGGSFKASELTGMDAAGMVDLGAHSDQPIANSGAVVVF